MSLHRNLVAGVASLLLLSALPSASTARAADGGTLKVGIAAETGNLDLLQNVSTLSSYTAVFDGLLRYGQNGVLEPALATAWSISKDGLSLTFELRKGVKFSDGTPFNAETAKWNLLRWMGVDDFSWIGVSAAFDKIVIDNPYKLTIKLKRPVPAAPLEMTIVRPVRFLSPKAVDAKGKQVKPIGTGPWIVKSYDAAQTVLVRNDAYWGKKPLFAKMELKVVPDEQARVNALRSGDLDVIGGDWVAQLSPRRAKMLKGANIQVVAEPGTAAMLLGFSPKSPIMKDKAVRDAIFTGVDRAAIASVLFEGFADTTADVFPKNVPHAAKRHPVPARNVARAQKYLTDGGWTKSGSGYTKGGAPLVIDFLVSEESLPGSRRIAEMIQSQLTEIGFQVQISSVDNATMHDRRPAFKYDMTFFTSYGAPYDPHGTLSSLYFTTGDSGPDGKVYVADELDRLVVAALEASGPARDVKMQAVFDWLYNNTAVCPLVVAQRLWAVNPRVKNFKLPATDYDLPFMDMTLAD